MCPGLLETSLIPAIDSLRSLGIVYTQAFADAEAVVASSWYRASGRRQLTPATRMSSFRRSKE
jgi:hypothetical protein